MVRWLTVVGATCALAAVGCASSTARQAMPATPTTSQRGSSVSLAAAGGSSGPIVACKIVVAADVAAVFGGTVTDGVAGKTPQYCDFTVTGTLKSGKSVDAMGDTVTVWWNEHALDPNSKVLNAAATTVPELGVAFYQPSGHALMVAYHGGTLSYQAEGPDDDQTVQSALVALAKATISR